ncbi:MAG TPA: hypothetical protein PK819_05755 [Thermomicrobiales bacterium]|nr:hypothetical protein [Thermomicrobiales bacterium]
MTPAMSGRNAAANYLKGTWDIDRLTDWAITLGDSPADWVDQESHDIAGHIMNWLWEGGPDVEPSVAALKQMLTRLLAQKSAAAD